MRLRRLLRRATRRGKRAGATASAASCRPSSSYATLRQAPRAQALLRRRLAARHSGDGGAAQEGLARRASTWPRRAATTPKATTTTTSATSSSIPTASRSSSTWASETYTAKTFSRAALRDLDHAVGLSQPAHHRRRDAARRPQIRARDVHYRADSGAAELSLDIAEPIRRKRAWNPGGAACAWTAPRARSPSPTFAGSRGTRRKSR